MGLMPFQINEYLTKKLIQDLTVECNNATQVVIKAGTVAGSDDGQAIMTLGSDLTLDITVAGDGGLDTSSEAVDTWYYVWLIQDISTGVVSGVLSVSSTAPTLPAGYTKKRLVSAVRNDGAGDFYLFEQSDRECHFLDKKTLANWSGSNWLTLSFQNFMPYPLARKAYVAPLVWWIGFPGTSSGMWYRPGVYSGIGSGGNLLIWARADDADHQAGDTAYILIDDTTIMQASFYVQVHNGVLDIIGYYLDHL